MIIMNMNRVLAATLLLAVVPVAGAWNLVNTINADGRNRPGETGYTVAASGSAGAYLSGVNQYPGRINCQGMSSCYFGPIAWSLGNNGLRLFSVMGCTSQSNCAYRITDTNVTVNNNITWDEAISVWVRRYGTKITRPYAYSYSVQPGWTKQICGAWAAYGTSNRSFLSITPGTDSCAIAPIPPNQCNVSGGAVDLNHGPLNTGAITGARREVTRQVTCRSRASIRYQVSVGNPVIIGNGIDSLITVNGVRAGQMITLPAGTSTLRIASTLTDKGAQTGAFSKSVVLIQSFM